MPDELVDERIRNHVAASLFTLSMREVVRRMAPPLTQETTDKVPDEQDEEIDEWWREDEEQKMKVHPSGHEEAIESNSSTKTEKPKAIEPILEPTSTTTPRRHAAVSVEQKRFIWGLDDEEKVHDLFFHHSTSHGDGDERGEGASMAVGAPDIGPVTLDLIHPTLGLLPTIYQAIGIHDSKKHYSLIIGAIPRSPHESQEGSIKDLLMMHASLLPSPQERYMAVQSLLKAAMSTRAYDSRSRSSISLVAQWLDLSAMKLRQMEKTAWALSLHQDESMPSSPSPASMELVAKGAKEAADSSNQNRRMRSALAVGGIAVGAGALLAVTGGLAAPFIAVGLGSLASAITGSAVSGAVVATGAASAAGTGVISASLGVLGATSVGTKAHKQLHSEIQGDFGYVDLTAYEEEKLGNGKEDGKSALSHSLLQLPVVIDRSEDGAASLTICINGWIAQPPGDFFTPWIKVMDPSVEVNNPSSPSQAPSGRQERSGCPNAFGNRFALLWEEELLSKLGSAIINLVKSQIINQASTHILSTMAVGALLTALALPLGVLAAMRLALGDCWHLALRRSKEAGSRLAHHLIAISESSSSRQQPVTLIGFSIGARLVFHALLELERQGKRGLVENAILIGSPVSSDAHKWLKARSVVSSRLVNCYSERDWVLGVMFKVRSTEGLLGSGVAGISPVMVEGVENIGLGRLMGNEGHEGYTAPGKMEEIIMDAVRLEC